MSKVRWFLLGVQVDLVDRTEGDSPCFCYKSAYPVYNGTFEVPGGANVLKSTVLQFC